MFLKLYRREGKRPALMKRNVFVEKAKTEFTGKFTSRRKHKDIDHWHVQHCFIDYNPTKMVLFMGLSLFG